MRLRRNVEVLLPGMRRYLRILKVFTRASLIRDMAFRGAFYIDLLHSILWLGVFFLLIEIMYIHTDALAGWNKGNLIVLLGVWSLLDDLASGTFWDGVKRIPTLVADGQMDFILTRPIDSQFIISVERFRFSRAISLIVDVALIAYGISLGGAAQWWSAVLLFPLMVIIGYITSFALFYFLHTLGFWFLRIDNIWALYEGFENVGKYPVDVFGRHIRLLSLTIVPITVMMVFPAEALVGLLDGFEILNGVLVAVVGFWLARKFYLYSLHRYSSIA